MKKWAVLLLLLLLVCGARGYTTVLAVTVADLMCAPQPRAHPVEFHHDPCQLTQLLYMDRVRVVQSAGSWTQVEALDQPMVYNGTWSGYIGWVESAQLATATALVRLPTPTHSVVVPYTHLMPDRPTFPLPSWLPNETLPDLSFGTWLEATGPARAGWLPVAVHYTFDSASPLVGQHGWVLARDVAVFVQSTDEATIRALLPQRAEHLLGYPYFWGGRSAFNFDLFRSGRQLTGLDCSGLTSICYRSLGVTIPRDASKQAMKTWNKLAATDLQVGDVFYLGMPFSSTDSVTHVMMLHSMAPEPMLVESADNNSTRILPVRVVFGAPLEQLQWGQTLSAGMDAGSTLTWGTFFPPK